MIDLALSVVIVVAGCDLASRPDPASAVRVAAAGRLILRARLTGGLAGLGDPGTVPDFSLYADGRVIVSAAGVPAGSATGTSPANPWEYRLTSTALRRLVHDARAAGLDRPRTFDPPHVADAFTLEITFGSVRSRIVFTGSGKTDPAVRFSRRWLDPATWAPHDLSGTARPYRVRRLAVLARELPPATGQAGNGGTRGRREGAEVIRWPLGLIGAGTPTAAGRCVLVGGPDLATVDRLSRTARPGTRWLSGGRIYSLRFRPLLPDESTCADLIRS